MIPVTLGWWNFDELKQAAILEGKLLYQRSDSDRISFQTQTLHEYEDYLHLSNIYNQFLDLKR